MLDRQKYPIFCSFQFRTLGSRPEGKPRRLRASSPSPSSLDLRWEDPDSRSWNGPLNAYKIGWREAGKEDEEDKSG